MAGKRTQALNETALGFSLLQVLNNYRGARAEPYPRAMVCCDANKTIRNLGINKAFICVTSEISNQYNWL